MKTQGRIAVTLSAFIVLIVFCGRYCEIDKFICRNCFNFVKYRADIIYVGVVDYSSLFDCTKAGISIKKQLETLNMEHKHDVEILENGIKSEVEKLSFEKNQEKIVSAQREIEEKHMMLYDMIRTKKSQMEYTTNLAKNEFSEVIKVAIAEIAEKNNVNLVVDVSDILYVKKSMDLTNEVIELVDQKLPNYSVKMINKENGV